METEPISPWFSKWARELADACRSLGFAAPTFRSPPSDPAVNRAVRRSRSRTAATVFVRLWHRPLADIREDMITGVLVANALCPATSDAARVRATLEAAAQLPSSYAA